MTLEVAESATSSFRNNHLALAAGWRGVSPLLMSFHYLSANRKSQPAALNLLAIKFEDLGRKTPSYLGAMLPTSLQNDGGYRG